MPRPRGKPHRHRGPPKGGSKKTYSKYAAAAKAKRTQARNAKRSKPGSSKIKKLALSNARAIATLKDNKYGAVQTNYSKMLTRVHVTREYPACLHLNSLYSGQTGEPVNYWLQAKQQFPGVQQPVMDNYDQVHPFSPLGQLMKDSSEFQPRPNGPEMLWKSTSLKFEISGWVADTHVDIYIVQQRTAKHLPDPWRTEHQNSDHADTYLPYILPQWNHIGSKPMTGNWIDRSQYKIIAHKNCYLDAVASHPPTSLIQGTADKAAELFAFSANQDYPARSAPPKTQACKYVTVNINPNMVVKQLKSATGVDNIENLQFSANSAEDKTEGPWSYDNIDPRQNLWAIVTTSDPGHDLLAPNHRVFFTCQRTNTWRDTNDTDRPSTGP